MVLNDKNCISLNFLYDDTKITNYIDCFFHSSILYDMMTVYDVDWLFYYAKTAATITTNYHRLGTNVLLYTTK